MRTPPHPPEPPQFRPFPILSSERIYDSPWCGLRRDELVLHDGSAAEHHVVEITPAVVVVPVLRDRSIVLIAQYRYVHGKTHWEVPAGRLHGGESPEQGALRELREESGCTPERLVRLPGFYPINGISDHYAHAFAALGCEQAHQLQLDRAEQIVAQRFTVDEVRALLRAGKLADAFTALSLYYYLDLVEPGARGR